MEMEEEDHSKGDSWRDLRKENREDEDEKTDTEEEEEEIEEEEDDDEEEEEWRIVLSVIGEPVVSNRKCS